MILYSLDKSLAINGINLRQEYQKGTVEEMQYLLVVHRRMSNRWDDAEQGEHIPKSQFLPQLINQARDLAFR